MRTQQKEICKAVINRFVSFKRLLVNIQFSSDCSDAEFWKIDDALHFFDSGMDSLRSVLALEVPSDD